uniref:Uncharacterized protein n=1 Tax=Neovison vison TaxID=452646 RepID=A0A8C7AKM4_NEOVI
MVVENVRKMWTKVPKSITGKKSKPVSKDHISKMFLCGAWVIMRPLISGNKPRAAGGGGEG